MTPDRARIPSPPPGVSLLDYYSQPSLLADAEPLAPEARAVATSSSPSPAPSLAAERTVKSPRTPAAWRDGEKVFARRERQNRLRREGAAALNLQPKLIEKIQSLKAHIKELETELDELRGAQPCLP
jgi:hypothetical protein